MPPHPLDPDLVQFVHALAIADARRDHRLAMETRQQAENVIDAPDPEAVNEAAGAAPIAGSLQSPSDALDVIRRSWPMIVDECRAVLGGELHYQAIVYHCLRLAGVPRTQLGMNVKQWIEAPITPLFQARDARKHELYRGGFEPIPDVVLFSTEVNSDWRRRQRAITLRHMLLAIEVKVSERSAGRLAAGETVRDVHKLAAHREEVRHLGGDMHPVVMIIDTAPEAAERMRDWSLAEVQRTAADEGVSFFYLSPEREIVTLASA